MTQVIALALSIAVLGGIWAFLALGPLSGFVLVWAGFIGWGCFFHSGANTNALVKTIIGNAYGAGYLAMCGRAFKPHAMMMWPHGRSAIMGPDQAANTLAMVRDEAHKRDGTSWTDEEREAYRAPVRKTFEDFANAYNYARHTWCDMVIDPLETRQVMGLLLDLAGRVPQQDTTLGVLRM